MKALKKLLTGILPSTEPKEQKPGTVYAVTGGKYLGEFFVFIEKVKGSYMFLSLPSMERRSVPYEKFQIGIEQKIMDKIDALNLSENTLIIFTSDNGGIRAISNQYPLRAGKGSYYEGGIKVPMIFSFPGKIEAKTESYERISNLDFYPTIKKLVGYSDNIDLDGEDLTPIFKGEKLKKRELYFHFPVYLEPYRVQLDGGTDPLFRTRPGTVIIKDNWKLHHYYEDNKFELYDLEKDISESQNLSEINKGKKNELLIDLNNWRKVKNAPIPSRLNPYYDQKYVDSLMFLIDKNLISGKVNKNE